MIFRMPEPSYPHLSPSEAAILNAITAAGDQGTTTSALTAEGLSRNSRNQVQRLRKLGLLKVKTTYGPENIYVLSPAGHAQADHLGFPTGPGQASIRNPDYADRVRVRRDDLEVLLAVAGTFLGIIRGEIQAIPPEIRLAEVEAIVEHYSEPDFE